MALIKCPECGQEISDKSTKCVHCGKVLVEEVVPKRFCSECGREVEINATECPYCGCPLSEHEKELKQQELKKVKKIIIPVAVVIGLVIIAIVVFNIAKSSLNEDERLAYQNAVKLQGMMKDPDSFKLYDEFFVLKHRDDGGKVDKTYTIFKYGATNGYGAVTTDEAIFEDDEYIMDYADEIDEDEDADNAERMKKAETKFNVLCILSEDDNKTWEKVEIDIEKIKKEMGIE